MDRSNSQNDWYQWNEASNSMTMSSLANNTKGNSEMFLQGNQVFGDWSGYQFDGQSERDWENDMFMSSLLEDNQPDTKSRYQPIGMYPEDSRTVPVNYISTDNVRDTQTISSNQCDFGSSKYMKYDSPQSMDWNKLDDDTSSHFIVPRKNQTQVAETRAPMFKISSPDDVNTYPMEVEHADEETSLRTTVLQDLEMVMTQLTPKMRVFFRDSFYRLAKNSREQHLPSQNPSEESTLNVSTSSNHHQETSMFGERKLMELETNAIDRIVANLTFNDLKCNEQDIVSAGSMEFSDDSVTGITGQLQSDSFLY